MLLIWAKYRNFSNKIFKNSLKPARELYKASVKIKKNSIYLVLARYKDNDTELYKQLLLLTDLQKMSKKMPIFKKEKLYNSIMLHLIKL